MSSTNRWANPVNNNLLRDAEGNLLAGGTLEIYAAGTSTPLAVYSDPTQLVSLGSTLTADAYGLLPDFHVPNGTQFKAIAKNSSGATKWTRDYLFGLDSATDSRLDALEASVNGLATGVLNAILNGGMRVGLNSVPSLTASFAEGKVNRLYGRVTNVSAGTLTQGADTGYVSGSYGHFSGVSTSSSGVVEAQLRIPSGEAARFVDGAAVFSCLVRQDTGGAINYTVTVKKPTVADNFGTLSTISTSGTTSVVSGTDTRLEFAVADMGDCSTGIAIEVSAAVGTITTKNFRITEAQFEAGAVRTSFVEQQYEATETACRTYGTAVTSSVGEAVRTAATQADARTAIGAGTSSLTLASQAEANAGTDTTKALHANHLALLPATAKLHVKASATINSGGAGTGTMTKANEYNCGTVTWAHTGGGNWTITADITTDMSDAFYHVDYTLFDDGTEISATSITRNAGSVVLAFTAVSGSVMHVIIRVFGKRSDE